MIKILPQNLVNQIAAGEVVERPSSVVKELVENSLDAGADIITVEVKDGGTSFIKIADNGRGMSREDLELAIKPHATSKIFNESDLWKISTMGFRGEALPSIASVSKMSIKSKRAGEVGGSRIDCVGGEVVSVEDVGMSDGTRVEVYELFFNTPARQKYLKRENTEFGHISSLINTIALAHPNIAFKLIHNEKTVSDFPKSSDLLSRIADVFGKNTAEAMIPIFYGGSEIKIEGFIAKPFLSRSTSQHQYIFVNGRPVQHYLLANRIKDAYHSMLMEHKKPIFILNMRIDPSLIDVNVHPRKTEIRFEDQETIIRAVYGCVKTSLEKANLIHGASDSFAKFPTKPQAESSRAETDFNRTSPSCGKQSSSLPYPDRRPSESAQYAIDFSRQLLKARDQKNIRDLDEKAITRAISQVSNSYIVAENEDGLILIDQHAAHERVRYEELMDQFEKQEKSVQPLLVPQQLELTTEEMSLFEEKKEIFEALGFEIEAFGGNTFVVHAVPGFLSTQEIDDVIKGVLDDIQNGKNPTTMQGRIEEIINYMACRSAIKFGQKLELPEMQSLILQLEKLKRPSTCPHGRPTTISLTLGDLDKMFRR